MNELLDVFKKEGICVSRGLLGKDILIDLEILYDEVMAGRYKDNPPRRRTASPDQLDKSFTKIVFPNIANKKINDVLKRSGVGEVASLLTGATSCQVLYMHFLNKAPSSSINNTVEIGWHQDAQYTKPRGIIGECITAHIVLGDMNDENGPLLYIESSHRSEPCVIDGISDFTSKLDVEEGAKLCANKAGIPLCIKKNYTKHGDVAFHHNNLIHASSANTSAQPRKTIVVHMRTEMVEICPAKSDPAKNPGKSLLDFSDFNIYPVLFGDEHCFLRPGNSKLYI